MSFDPQSNDRQSNDPQGGPGRPRSTPIPDADGGGFSMPPPTAAQYLGEQSSLPWTPQPGPNVNAPFNAGFAGIDAGTSSRSGLKILVLVIALVSVVGAGAIAFVASRAADDFAQQLPNFPQAPTTSPRTTENVHPNATSVLPPVVLTPTTFGPAVVLQPSATDGLATTLPTPPPTTLPAPPPTDFPDGAATLYDGSAPRAVVEQMSFVLVGAPLTQVVITSDFAVATAQDPSNPGQLIGAQWRDRSVSNADITSSGGPQDLSFQLFTEADVNWEAIGGLVQQAPGLLGLADGQVTQVQVQRIGTGNPPPVVIDVYVDGPSGKGFVEASAAGDVLSANPG
ncbi:MAG: hypothetical protein JWL72_215 [Ilumatobacteraceae bacterium]|nr:hypothetical protein [Ilumatobacteraceae bacterium]MCU1386877.1 hypothetical protein [Ilumatobacteraceae bacterium]